MDHERDGDIPNWLKWSLAVFNRAGFPALAFLIIAYICFTTLKDQTTAIQQLKDVFLDMRTSVEKNTNSVERMTNALYRTRP